MDKWQGAAARVFLFGLPALVLSLGACPAFAQARTPAAGEPIILAYLGAFSGPTAEDEEPLFAAAALAVKAVNARGGVAGRPLVLEAFDTKGSPLGARQAAIRAEALGAQAAVGPSWSSQALSAGRALADSGMPMLATVATHPDVTAQGPHVFRVCFTDTFQGELLGRFARLRLGVRAAAVMVNVQSDYSINLGRSFRAGFGALGGRVLVDAEYKRDDADFAPQLRRIRESGVDLVFVPGHGEAGRVLGQAADMGLDTVFLGGDGWDAPSFLREGAARVATGYYTTHWTALAPSEANKAFIGSLDRTGVPPLAGTALSFDAVMLLAYAMEETASHGGAPPGRQALREALASLPFFEGVTGRIRFDAQGDPVKPAYVMRLSYGEASYVERIDPAPTDALGPSTSLITPRAVVAEGW